jgi:hypothetical protein
MVCPSVSGPRRFGDLSAVILKGQVVHSSWTTTPLKIKIFRNVENDLHKDSVTFQKT